ncbi:LAGLIDADG endonuclease [Cenococcum geophilum 1.58]|uniref:LAGLIDADG endonuclease n=1 Tax=Cenococcum geophilum 1.58 TaxID=794803 RepID=A0ACC8EJW2_9PEZI|nr:LAGLIDADG endonuclease [Cenococcum geophilum 1.58]
MRCNNEPHYGDVVLKILLNAGTSPNLGFAYELFLVIISITFVKIAMTWRKPAEVRSLHTLEASQRLHAGDLIYAYLVGLFEGDGFFSITKKGKYLTDVQLIYKIKKILGIGVVSFRNRNGIEMVSLRIKNKNHLKNIIIPMFDKYPMFSNKQYDYLRFRDGLITVGFIEAEGCFSVYKLNKNEDYFVASFDLAQKNGQVLITAIRKYLSFTTTVYMDKTNCYKLKVSSVRSLENVIKFLNNTPVKLLGNKKLQYLL